MKSRTTQGTLLMALLATMAGGCGGTIDRTCDDPQPYQSAAEGRKLETPDGLDELDELREMPIPVAEVDEPRQPGAPCIDIPPGVRLVSEEEAASRDAADESPDAAEPADDAPVEDREAETESVDE